MTTSLVKCRNLTKTYGRATSLDNINFEIPRGQVIGLLGKNGAGKSTLMKLIMGLLTPTKGQILVNNQPLGATSNNIISFLPDCPYLDPSQTIKQTLHFFNDFYDNFDLEKAEKLITALKLNPNSELKTLSKGMLEKTQLAITISRNVDLYMLDEPIGGVDPATRDSVLRLILHHVHPKSSVLISTHIISDVEDFLDSVIILDQGKLVLSEDAKTLKNRTKKSIDKFFREEFKDVLEDF